MGTNVNQCALTVQIGWGTQDTQFSIIVHRGGATGARKGRDGEIQEASQNRRILLVCQKEKAGTDAWKPGRTPLGRAGCPRSVSTGEAVGDEGGKTGQSALDAWYELLILHGRDS